MRDIKHSMAQDSEKRKKEMARQDQYILSQVERETLGCWPVES